MVSLLSLWLPILLSPVFVFAVSSFIHMVLQYHSKDFRKLPDEDGVMKALRPFALPPGEYVLPHAGSMKGLSAPDYLAKRDAGPVAMMMVAPSGPTGMARGLLLWFVYSLVVSGFAAYIAGRALEPGAHYLAVFRFVGTTAFIGYALALCQNSIWYRRAWSTTIKTAFDGLIYGLVTAGVFGWLWP